MLDHQPTRLLSICMTTHAIGSNEQTIRTIIGIVGMSAMYSKQMIFIRLLFARNTWVKSGTNAQSNAGIGRVLLRFRYGCSWYKRLCEWPCHYPNSTLCLQRLFQQW